MWSEPVTLGGGIDHERRLAGRIDADAIPHDTSELDAGRS
jgi:hypothetical protein